MSGVLAAFTSEDALRAALPRLRAAQLGPIETYTPRPLEEGPSLVPLAVFVAGVLGTAASLWLQTYANVWAYPLDIGGRPPFSWPSFIPIALENGILAAIGTGFFGYLIACRLPRLYEPIDECEAIRRATRDLWCVAVHAEDEDRARCILRDCGADSIEGLPE
jgi:hypothetical protein